MRSPVSRASWHRRAGALVAGWLTALLVVTLVHPFVPAWHWLLVHLLVLGAASTAILIWSWHFTTAVLRMPEPVTRRGQTARLAVFTAGALAVVAGMTSGLWACTLAGGLLVAATVGWHCAALWRRLRAALPSRFGGTVRYYVAAGLLLPVGVALGVAMGNGGLPAALQARFLVAHALLNLLGWIGLTVIGTLVTLWPTMLRTRIADGVERSARWILPMLLAGVVVAAAGALAGLQLLTAGGVLVYLAGVLVAAAAHLDEVRRKPPVDFSTASVLAGTIWLAGSLLLLAVGIATATDWAQAADRVGWVTVPLLAGFVAQVLLGSLSYLLPVVLGGGPSMVRATSTELGRGAAARVAAANVGLLVCVLPVPSLVRVLVSMVVLVALASFLPLLLRAVLITRRAPARPATATSSTTTSTPGSRPSAQRRVGLAAVGLAAVLLAAVGGVALDPVAAGAGPVFDGAAGVTPTGRTTTVQVSIQGMRFVPGIIDVPVGDRLVVVLRNTGEDTHDLVLASGVRTPRIAPGEQATMDAGVVGADIAGWCSVAGHRQMGMVLTVRAVGATPIPAASVPAGDDQPAAGRAAGAAADLDLMAPPGAGFRARDPRLAPAPAGSLHQLTLRAQEVQGEVAPGVTQTLWTFNGTAPGPTLHGRIGDVFEITLVNDGSIGHSIDFHAGALAPDQPMRTIQPGQSLTYRFTATRSGIWLYHCASMPMSLHIANGMFGAVVIDPPDLPPVDREYLLVQSEMYLGPQGGIADPDKIGAERPDLVVFNGYANQYDHAPLTARAGERVRIWVLDAGPQRGSAFHVVGGQFDTVWQEGAYLLPPGTTGGAQVLALGPAQGGFVELTLPEAGHYPFVTHAMVDAERGAHGILQVTG